ncbi:vWA domain-containing protein [Enemella sp. A6]|uniref:vWA domain-containing protein n=1 Tax=Enemella sp. A6 TaxID=3440152 RepID=UPI003EB7587A
MTFHPDWIALMVGLVALAAAVVLLLRSKDRITWLRRVGIALAFVLITVRPVVGASASTGQASDLDVILVVDRTTSMAAEDYDGNNTRLTGVHHDVREIATQFTGARFVLISFDNDARVELPPSTDTTAVASIAESLGYMDAYYGAGSTISVAIPVIAEELDRMAEEEPGRKRMLIYLGDGENTSDQSPESFADLAGKIDAAAVLGYGTTSGGRMKHSPDRDRYVYDYENSGDAISRIDEEALRKIASELDGEYLHRTAPDDLELKRPDQGFAALSGGEVTSGVDLSWIFGTVLVGLALWEAWLVAVRFRQVRRELR